MSDRRYPARPRRAAGTLLPLLAGVLALASGPATAKTADRQLPADIEAGSFRDDPETGMRIFRDGFIYRQGTLEIRADEARVKVDDAGEVVQVLLTGAPATWREELDDGVQLDAAARRIDYAVAEERVVLREDVVVDRGTDRITGDTIRYDMKTSQLDAGGGEGRVRVRITPRRSGGEPDRRDR